MKSRPKCLHAALAFASLTLGCAPPLPSQDGGTTTSQSESESESEDEDSSSSSSSESGEDPTTSTETDPSTDTSLDFVPNHDWADSGLECDPWSQDCPDGEKCAAADFDLEPGPDSNECVPITGNGGLGDPCEWDGPVEASDDCDGEHACYFVAENGDTWLGTCAPFCDGTPDDPICPGMLGCYITGQGAQILCLPSCDPLLQDCTDPNSLCQWTSSANFVCIQRGADVGTGEPCSVDNDCAAGDVCLGAMLVPGCADDACCTSYCEVGMLGGCDAQPDTSCEPFFSDPPPPGFELIGVCIVP